MSVGSKQEEDKKQLDNQQENQYYQQQIQNNLVEKLHGIFDIIYQSENSLYNDNLSESDFQYESECIYQSYLIMKSFSPQENFKIKLSHSSIVTLLLEKAGFPLIKLYKMMCDHTLMKKIFDLKSKLTVKQDEDSFINLAKKRIGIDQNTAQKLLRLINTSSSEFHDFYNKVLSFNNNQLEIECEIDNKKYQELKQSLNHLETLTFNWCLKHNIPEEIIEFDLGIFSQNMTYFSGMMFQVVYYDRCYNQSNVTNEELELGLSLQQNSSNKKQYSDDNKKLTNLLKKKNTHEEQKVNFNSNNNSKSIGGGGIGQYTNQMSNVTFQAEYMGVETGEVLIQGGRYNNLLCEKVQKKKKNTSHSNKQLQANLNNRPTNKTDSQKHSTYQSQISAVGFNVLCDKVYEVYYKPSIKDKKYMQQILTSANPQDVLVVSLDEPMLDEKINICSILWRYKIKAQYVRNNISNITQITQYEKSDLKYIITLSRSLILQQKVKVHKIDEHKSVQQNGQQVLISQLGEWFSVERNKYFQSTLI